MKTGSERLCFQVNSIGGKETAGGAAEPRQLRQEPEPRYGVRSAIRP